MAGPTYGLNTTFVPSAAITKHRAVEITALNTVTTIGTLGDRAFGISIHEITAEDATNGRPIAVQVQGIARCIAGAVLTANDPVRVDAAGRVVALAAVTANQNMLGIILTSPGAIGEHCDVLLTPATQRST